MHNKGQGALEYLLLIGGAIVVAVIVVTLLLGVGSSGGATNQAGAASAICSQKAATTNQNCDLNTSSSGIQSRVVWIGNSCYDCGGTVPKCSVTVTTAANWDTQAECQSN